jgi:hypothetical protein
MSNSARPLDRFDIARDAVWRGNDLLFRRRLVACVKPDATYPNMWRVSLPNGRISDMVNLTRAKDAAICLALTELNDLRRRESRVRAPPVSQSEPAAISMPSS